MIELLLAAHVIGVVAVAALAPRLGRGVFAVAAVPAALTTIWALARLGADDPATADAVWVAGLDLAFDFRVDALAALVTVVVSGIGVAVFVYAAGYFSPGAAGLGRFAATLLAFSGAMVGLVWADSVWTLFVFWELTSITSFLLVGHKYADATARLAARRALLVTVGGGLALLAGFVVFVDTAGTTRLSDLDPVPTGAGATVAAVLVLLAAATKSAQVPFHVWLPGAMAAPTPVSAYLHSATMVKAGVLLVAVMSPALGDVPVWTVGGLALGGASMLWGAIGALRQTDAKLILAWGTVSQLGLMITMFTLGTPKAVFAGVAVLVAHAVFKAALFMVVGEVDVRTGTRDIHRLSGLARSMPLATAVAAVSGASMAGAPPLLGFPAKEAAIEAVLGADGVEGVVATVIVVAGSVLTVAYTVRFLVGVFGPSGAATDVAPARPSLVAPSVVLGAGSLVGFVALGWVTDVVRSAAVEIDPAAEVYSLLRWPGLTTAFVTSALILAAGVVLGLALSRRTAGAPRALGAELADRAVDGVLVLARRLTARVQHGSLPVYMATMAFVAAVATVPFATSIDPDAIDAWDRPLQAVLGLMVVAAAVSAAVVGSRLGAALGLGGVGFGVAALFVVQGAPDLAITQLLVETVVVVGFVVALGHLTRRFPPVGQIWRGVRLGVALLLGTAVVVALLSSGSAPSGQAAVEELTEQSVDDGGGNNVVNVILTDVRALDTLGEVIVLMVVAIGILALAAAGRRDADGSDDPAGHREVVA